MPHPLDYIFRPRSVAVIGASTQKGTLGREILHNIIEYEFNGKVFPVNPRATVIHSIKCYSTILDVPDAVDLAVIAVPRDAVLPVVDQCGQKGVKGLVVITAGFKETGPKGAELERQLGGKVADYGMRMIGPNCFGVINTEPEVRLNATFSKTKPLGGTIAFESQSGAMGEAILYHAQQINLGFSMFASVGNKTNVSGNDLLQYWRDDPNTKMILLYLENFGNPRKFTQIARQLTRKKPIIAVKSGRTMQGARAATSHTGALAGLDVGVDALLSQCGVIRASSIEEMFDTARAMATQPFPRGKRVAIVTNAGGPGIMTTDACVNLGLEIVHLTPETKKKLREFLPEEASVENPVDMIASATAERYGKTLAAVLADPQVDAVIVLCVPPINVNAVEVAQAIISVRKNFPDKPLLASFMGVAEHSPGTELLIANGIPAYTYPESMVKALADLLKYRQWLARPEGQVKVFSVKKVQAEAIITEATSNGQKQLVGEPALNLLAAYGIPIAPYAAAATPEEAVQLAAQVGFPVVLKLNSPKLLHKTEVGGVLVDLRGEKEVSEGFRTLEKRYRQASGDGDFSGVVVQQMIKSGVETVIGMVSDPGFGPLMMFGLGGIYVEVLKDVAFKIHPLTEADAWEMVKSLKSYPLLAGFRGAKPVDLEELVNAILKLSQLVSDFPQIDQFDINPFIVSPRKDATRAVDARFLLR